MNEKIIEPIAVIKTGFKEKFGIPRQSLLVPEVTGEITFLEKYRDKNALNGLMDFDYVWLIWGFSKVKPSDEFSPTVRPPKLGGNKRMGVFATRSPFRPNGLALSCVRLLGIDFDKKDGPKIRVGGVDILDGSPIYDIKPYVTYVDAHEGARGGFSVDGGEKKEVIFDCDCEALTQAQKREVEGLLSLDPHPLYNDDESRAYFFKYLDFEIKFSIFGDEIHVLGVSKD